MSELGAKILALHHALEGAGAPHALGGAISLAYAVEEARATHDIDINVFVPYELAGRVLDSLPTGVVVRPQDRQATLRDGQVRLWWDETPVDLFFNTVEFHDVAAGRTRIVPFEGDRIPVLSATDLAVCKALFGRSKDWVDIEAMRDAGSIDGAEATRWTSEMIGADHPHARRLAEILEAPPQELSHGDRLPPALRPRPGRTGS
ncbi:MAG TPA: hypothetical protein VMU63_10900 [Acidimicrobiales bacterium]|nr:hypothetical protein [Acidimicrobiales bacterium]